MKGYTHDNSKEVHTAELARPPYAAVGQTPVMDRTAPAGVPGDSEKLVTNAKYGVDGYEGSQTIVEMPRTTAKAMGGSGKSSLPPATATYGIGGAGDQDYNNGKKCYGVSGIDSGGSGNGPKRSSLRAAGVSR